MALALFDLDNTLLNGDSDHAWGLFLAEIGAVNAAKQKTMQDYFYQQYLDGSLNIVEFLNFQLAPLGRYSMHQLHAWRSDFLHQVVQPMLQSGKTDLLEPHRRRGDDIVIVTATNDFITRPIADLLGVDNLIATTAELKNGAYTGKSSGVPCFQQGKVTRVSEWIATNEKAWAGSYFYSDSINDRPLLERVDTPVAVTPDSQLRSCAKQNNWPIID
ncbi:MAG: HAD family hydrolase [Gammaproteobacteria bacterium]|nr:HAD family hydrolase [Gammaproteobacteria bacterium]